MPRPRKPIGELMARANRSLTTCPNCGEPGFYSGKPWGHKGEKGTLYRTRVCRFCGHAKTERVTVRVEDVATPEITDTGVQFEFTPDA